MKSLGLRLMDWHSGQWSATYSTASQLVAGIQPSNENIEACIRELTEEIKAQHNKALGKAAIERIQELNQLISELECTVGRGTK